MAGFVYPPRDPKRLLTEVDHRAYEALHHVLRPEYHALIPEWLRTANEKEKRGFILMADIAEPTLTRAIGRPLAGPLGPPTLAHNWYHLKAPPGKPHRMNWPIREPRGMSQSASDPALDGTRPSELGLLQWQQVDLLEAQNVSKPGGYAINLRDNVDVMNMKTKERNKGTFKLFGGTFDATTNQATSHGLRSIGMEGWQASARMTR